jgi:hypothetical protein
MSVSKTARTADAPGSFDNAVDAAARRERVRGAASCDDAGVCVPPAFGVGAVRGVVVVRVVVVRVVVFVLFVFCVCADDAAASANAATTTAKIFLLIKITSR